MGPRGQRQVGGRPPLRALPRRGPGLQKPRLQTVGGEGLIHPRPSPAGCPHPGPSHSSIRVLFGWVQPPGCREAWEVRAPAGPRVTFLAVGPPASCCMNPARQLWVRPLALMSFCIRACRAHCSELSQDAGLSPCRVCPPGQPAAWKGGARAVGSGPLGTLGLHLPWAHRSPGDRGRKDTGPELWADSGSRGAVQPAPAQPFRVR